MHLFINNKESLESLGNVTYGIVYGSEFELSDGYLAGFVETVNLTHASLSYYAETQGFFCKTFTELDGCDSTGFVAVNDNPQYYQFGVSINDFEDNIDLVTKWYAACFIQINGDIIYLNNECKESVSSKAGKWLDEEYNSKYENHRGALNYLASLVA